MHLTARRAQHGAATLVLTATLLLIAALMAWFAHSRLWFEQRASANQVRAAQATELAHAGQHWALAQLNTTRALAPAPSCELADTAPDALLFRERYTSPRAADAGTGTASGLYPAAGAQAGCTLTDSGALHCVCPEAGQPLLWSDAVGGRFRVQFLPVPDDPLAVEVLSTGCSGATPACPGGTDTQEASAYSRQILKLAPALVSPPDAAIEAGGDIHTTGTLRVAHLDGVVAGAALRAGGSVSTGADTVLQGLAGDGTRPATIADDPTLRQLRDLDATGTRFFEIISGRSQSGYQLDPLTRVIGASHCGTPTDCGALLMAWHHQGGQQFWLDTEVTLDATGLSAPVHLGTGARPVLVASAGRLNLTGDLQIRGLVLAGDVHIHAPPSGGGTATIVGALVARGSVVQHAGTLSVVYDRSALGMAGGTPAGLLTPLPGSWRDRLAAY